MFKRSLALVVSLLLLVHSALAFGDTSDPLFLMMLGHWEGKGLRTQLASGHQISIFAQTEATFGDDKLISSNEITETPVDSTGAPLGHSRKYVREYWIRALGAGRYEFGIGSGADEKVFSEGVLHQDILELEQQIGNTAPYIIHSRTRFEGDVRDYTELVSQEGRQLSRTRIRYQRQAD